MDKTNETAKADSAIEDAVQRSGPRPRPRLGTELEDRLAPTEAKAAAQYASMENMATKLHALADEIDLDEDDLLPLYTEDDDAVPQAVDFEDSLVQNIEEVRAQLIRELVTKKPTE